MSTEARRERGLRLRAAREVKDLSQAALADLLGVKQVTVWRWEAGERMPSFEARLLMVDVLGEDPYAIDVAPVEGAA